jgi:hypothetical protein
MKKSVAALVVLGVLAALIWASDRITFEGERTIYTVDCHDGTWNGLACTGRLVAGERYRFRASKSRNEVIYWTVGSAAPSVTFTDCSVRNRGNWECNAKLGQPAAITLQMADDRATHGPSGLTVPFHAIDKWRWWLLRNEWMSFREASY